MRAYIDEVILTVVICRIASMMAPDGETKGRYLAAVCALVTLISLISPVKYIADNIDTVTEAVAGFFLAEKAEKSDEARDNLSSAAAVIFKYAEEKMGFDTEGAEITFYTDEEGKVNEVMLFFKRGRVRECEKLKKELEKELKITVHVYTGEVNEDGK